MLRAISGSESEDNQVAKKRSNKHKQFSLSREGVGAEIVYDLGIGNGVGNRVAAIDPPINDTDPIRKFSIDPGSHTDWQKQAEFSPKGKPIRNFSIDPTSSIQTPVADAIFCGRHFRDSYMIYSWGRKEA